MEDNNKDYISFKNNRFQSLKKESQFVISENHIQSHIFHLEHSNHEENACSSLDLKM